MISLQEINSISSRCNVDVLWKSIQVFFHRRGAHLAAASTFYLILSIIPLLLLVVRFVGWILGSSLLSEDSVLSLVFEMFPSEMPGVSSDLQKFLDGPLKGAKEYTIFNFAFLCFAGLSFLASLWSGLFFMSEDRSFLKASKHIKGLVLLFVGLVLLGLLFVLPGVLHTVAKALQNNRLALFLYENLEGMRPFLEWIRSDVPEFSFLTTSPFFYGPILIFYFAFCYRTFFNFKVYWRESLLASSVFILSMIAGKSAFWMYFFLVRDRLVSNYGNFYSLLVAIVWLYILMCFFFFGASMCCVFTGIHQKEFKVKDNGKSEEKNQEKGPKQDQKDDNDHSINP